MTESSQVFIGIANDNPAQFVVDSRGNVLDRRCIVFNHTMQNLQRDCSQYVRVTMGKLHLAALIFVVVMATYWLLVDLVSA